MTMQPYDPAWKIPGTPNLSTVGKRELAAWIKRGERTGTICSTFRICSSAVRYWRQRT